MALTDENGGMSTTMLMQPANAGAYPVYMGNGNNSGFGEGNGWWVILLIIILVAAGGWGNNQGNGGFGGGQPIIVSDNGGSSVQRGFDQAAVIGGINGVQAGIYSLSTQLCNCCGDMQSTVANGINTIQGQLYNNTIADLERSFAAQTASTQGMTALSNQLAQCCCDNRLASERLNYTIATENCADRAAISDGIRDIIVNQTASTQRILDQLCQDKIDAKNERIADLERQLTMANLSASQTAQTSRILADNAAQTVALEQYLNPVPVPAYVVSNPNCCNQNNCNMNCGCGIG